MSMDNLSQRLRAAATDKSIEWPADLLVEASKAIDQLIETGIVKREPDDRPKKMFIDGTWLVEITSDCTCSAAEGEGHNSLCGVKSIVDLATVPGFEEMENDPKGS